jgi:hypothetical protein
MPLEYIAHEPDHLQLRDLESISQIYAFNLYVYNLSQPSSTFLVRKINHLLKKEPLTET